MSRSLSQPQRQPARELLGKVFQFPHHRDVETRIQTNVQVCAGYSRAEKHAHDYREKTIEQIALILQNIIPTSR